MSSAFAASEVNHDACRFTTMSDIHRGIVSEVSDSFLIFVRELSDFLLAFTRDDLRRLLL